MGLIDLLSGKQQLGVTGGSVWDRLSSGLDNNRQMMRMGGLASVLGADPNQVMQSAMLGNGMDDKRRVRTQEEQRKNKTIDWLKNNRPDLAAQVEAGMPVSEAFKAMNQKPKARRILQGADGFNYFEDGSRVLPNVQRQQKPQYRQVSGQEAQKLGLNPQHTYNVGPDGRISQIGGGGTNVTVNNSGENEYNKTINRHWADENIAIAKKAQAAQSNIGKLQYLGDALRTPSLYTGAGGESVLKLKNAAAALGMDVDVEALGAGQAVQAIVNRMAMEMRNPENGGGLPGAASDADREFLKQSIPNLTKNPEGNRKLIEYAIRLEERNIEVDQLRRSYVKQYGQLDDRFYDYLAQWSEQNPLFPEAASGEYNSPVASGKTQNGVSWGRVE
nr:hypothetical protein [uncultured Cohaesibacter sp.]